MAYANGQGVPQDAVQAAVWCSKAAEQGLAEAQYALGDMFLIGCGVLRDYQQARAWYRKAAEQGHANARGAMISMDAKDKMGRPLFD
ncbi:tetratricopeptide repeat protein [Aeromonas media]|uniref:tetratricopeptide repeat protein n=1 Tax=Aeromonas media TaxID=651 RepID=UPI0002787C24|nr:tetratricopeptide repeat protein [Aeromonas media]